MQMRPSPRVSGARMFCLSAIAVVQMICEPAFAQDGGKLASSKSVKKAVAGKSDSTKPQTVRRDYVDAAKFIDKIISLAEPVPRGEFESREAYEARQPKLSASETTLVRLERGYKDYAYDFDSKTLSIRIPVGEIKPNKTLQGFPLRVAYEHENKGGYTASNAYGARVTVEKTWSTQYLLYVPNEQLGSLVTVTDDPVLASLPDNLRRQMAGKYKKTTVALTINAEPNDAERIAKDSLVLLSVRPKGLQDTVHEATFSSKPTISEPRESTLFTRAIGVDLVEIIIRDGKTGKTILKKAVHDAGAEREDAEKEKRDAVQRTQDEERQKLMAERERREVEERARQEAVREEAARGPQWAESDNGEDINWNEATQYCASKGSNWRLPTSTELQTSYQSGRSTPCGESTCKASSNSRLTAQTFWSNEQKGSSEAWYVNLDRGDRFAYRMVNRRNYRALCVRQP